MRQGSRWDAIQVNARLCGVCEGTRARKPGHTAAGPIRHPSRLAAQCVDLDGSPIGQGAAQCVDLDGSPIGQGAADLLGELFRSGAVSVQLSALPESGLVQCVVLRPDKSGRLTDAGKVRTTAATPAKALHAAANSGRFRPA